MTSTHDETQRLVQQCLTAHPDMAALLRGDTATRHSAQMEIVGYVLRHWTDRHKLNYWDEDLLRRDVIDDVQSLTAGMVT